MARILSVNEQFPELPFGEWAATKKTLHLMLQIVGKVRMKLTPEKNHWWNVTLYVSTVGLTTGPIPYGGYIFEIQMNLANHRLDINTSLGDERSFHLSGLSVAEFYTQLFDCLNQLGIEVSILAQPYDGVGDKPFAKDFDHKSYDLDYVERYWHVLIQANSAFYLFSTRFLGKSTPAHLFWHSMDIAYTRFSGREAPPMPSEARVSDRNAYSHEVISFGFWPGDEKFGEAAFYGYAFPSPGGLQESRLSPEAAMWVDQNGSPMAILKYEDVRKSNDPQGAILEFCESVYQSAAKLADWDVKGLTYTPYR